MFKGLENKVAVVTGGGRGIGRAIVSLFAEEGVDVTFFYHHSQESALALVEEAAAKGLKLSAFKVDVRDKQQCKAAMSEVYQRTGRIDVLVNNSGIIRDNLLAAMTEDELKDVLDTNVCGVFFMTQAAVPYMMSQRSGSIINISSVCARKGGRGQANYVASKAAVEGITKSLAAELASKKIRVNAVAPGVIDTDMSKHARELALDEIMSKILLKRFGKPEEIAYAAAFLASDYSSYITGAILRVDGGFKMA